MKARRWQLCGWITAAAILTTGCNPFLAPYFAMMWVDQKIPAEYKLASDDKEKEVKVVILASNGLETRPEFLRADYELSQMLALKLKQGFERNKEKVSIVPLDRISKYKDNNPRWQTQAPAEIGQHFEADYVINLEINELHLYERGSGNRLFKGYAAISVDVTDVANPDVGPVYRKEYTCDYPRGRSIPVEDTHPQQFRLGFYNRVTDEISWLFTAHPYDNLYNMD